MSATPSASVRTLQRSLKNAGFSPGAVDGLNGPHTRSALEQYQEKAGLPVTGRADPATMSSFPRQPMTTANTKPPGGSAQDANDQSKANFPDKKTTSAVQPCPNCKCPAANGLGSLSAGYESGGQGSKAIGYDTTGGYSYGKYQIESKGGTMTGFLDDLKTSAPDASKTLEDAGGITGAKAGTKDFKAAWKSVAGDSGLQDAEHAYIKDRNYDPNVTKLDSAYGLDVTQHSAALQDVVWSVAVQHGPGGKTNPTPVLNNAFKGKDVSKMSDSEMIDAIYDERSKTATDAKGNTYPAYFKSSTPKVQQSVMSRYQTERFCAQQALTTEEAKKAAQTDATPAPVTAPPPG